MYKELHLRGAFFVIGMLQRSFLQRKKATTSCDSFCIYSVCDCPVLPQHLTQLVILAVDFLHRPVVPVEIVRMVDLDQILVALPK